MNLLGVEDEQNLIINRLRAIWSKGYQNGSQRNGHQNDDYLKTSNAKRLSSRRIRTCSLIRRAFFALLVFK